MVVDGVFVFSLCVCIGAKNTLDKLMIWELTDRSLSSSISASDSETETTI